MIPVVGQNVKKRAVLTVDVCFGDSKAAKRRRLLFHGESCRRGCSSWQGILVAVKDRSLFFPFPVLPVRQGSLSSSLGRPLELSQQER